MKLLNLDFSSFFTILYSEKQGDYLTVTIGFILLIGGIICVVFGIFDAIRYSKTVEAKVIKSEPSYRTKRGDENVYFNTYEYAVNNKKYRVELKETEHELGYSTTLHYNSSNPRLARVTNSKKMCIAGAVIIVLAVLTITRGFEIANSLK